jgi:hypothetical protein
MLYHAGIAESWDNMPGRGVENLLVDSPVDTLEDLGHFGGKTHCQTASTVEVGSVVGTGGEKVDADEDADSDYAEE